MNQINWSDGRLWRPEIKGGSGPMYRRIADALQADVGAGTLVAGVRLPTQRQLSADLGVSVGTANAAYLEAERRGLVRRRVGSGTFVASPGTRAFRPDGHINLAVNLPPFHSCAPLIRDLLTQLVEDADATELLGYPLFRADGRYATAASMWIARTTTMPLLPPREVIPCQGATQGMLAIMDYLFQRGDRIACEQVTYGGFKVVARLLGLKLHPIGQDSEGLCPDSLEKACRDNQVRGLLICPTHQNPTGATTRACPRFCVNGPMAGNCRQAWRHDEQAQP